MTTRQRLTPTGKLLLRACVKGDMTLASSVLYTDPAALNARNKHGLNALQVAIIHQQLRMANYLIDKGVNVRSVDKNGWTPLHDAALYGNKDLVKRIIAEGSRVTCNNQLGEKPIDVAGNVAMEILLCKCMREAGFAALSDQYCESLGLNHMTYDHEIETTLPSDQLVTNRAHNEDETITDSNEYYSSARDFRPKREYPLSSKREAIHMDINTPCGRLSTVSRDSASITSHREFKRKRIPLSPLREVTDSAIVAAPLSETESPTPRRRPSSPVPRQRRSGSKASSVRSHACEEVTARTNEADMLLTQEDIVRLNGLYEKRQHSEATAEQLREEDAPPERESPVELLKMRPRKPSIVSRPSRRESRDSDDGSIASSSRRSVTFQPEVLLQEIVTEGDATLVGEVLSSGVVTDVNKMSPVGLTALHQSALDGNLPCAKTLVLNGADVNIVDSDGWTPLHAAAASGHTEIVRFLLQAGSDYSAKTDDEKTAYDLATRRAIKRMLLRVSSGKGVDPDEEDMSDGELSSDEEDCNHADYDSDDEDSSQSDSDHKVFTLGVNRSSILSPRDNSISPSPIRDSMDSVFSILHTSNVTTILERDPSDSTSSYGSLAEHEVELTVGTPSTLCGEEICLYTDRDAFISEDQGFSTMDASSDSSHQKAVLSDDEGTSHDVLDGDLDPGTLDYKFQEAVLNTDIDSLLKLIKQRSDINVNRVNTTSGVSALHHSVLEDNFTLVQHLVKDFECDVNLKDVEGWTPLHAASAVGSIRIAQFLLDSGAKPSILNNNGVFPVDVAEDAAMEALLKKAMLGPLHTGGKLLIKGLYI